PKSTFLIAEVGGLVAGYAKLHAGEPAEDVDGPKPVELVRLYVSREWIGRGVGEALMRACVNQARAAGYQTIWLGVWERNGRAQAFYRKWNFRTVGEHIFQLGSDPQRDILMERAVEPNKSIASELLIKLIRFYHGPGTRDCVLLKATPEGIRERLVSFRSLAVAEFWVEIYHVSSDQSVELLWMDDFCFK